MAQAKYAASLSLRLMVVGSLALTDLGGCATGNLFASSVDPNDACGVQRRDFYDSRNYWMSSAASGAVEGAFTGAAAGALWAWATGQNVGRGAAIGAGTGAVVGASAKYFEAQQKQAKDEASLANSIYGDEQKASGEYDRVSTTFLVLKKCRFDRATFIKSEYKQGLLTAQQANDQLTDQRKRMADDIALAKKYGEKMAEQGQSFEYAAGALAKDDPAAQQKLQQSHQPKSAPKPPPPTSPTDYTINAPSGVNVHKESDPKSARIAGLNGGAKIEPEGDPVNGMQKIKFDGGTEGWVSSRFISSPTGGTGVARNTSSSSKSSGTATASTTSAEPATTTAADNGASSGDKKVAVASVTGTIAEKRESYDQSVASADSDSAVAFNLNQ